ncbi:hypothetical protein [Cellulomonas fengjieae]|uniref:glycosyl-4,4'-diaponeurosporenoate acyltransferase CrtO family protein n=1 Tax=Cellulomonas fengjieae TaxID=2819978 RepID=UPI001AAF48DF|nr:hypothetical protein [Cellulomonas fengjieae]MBO3101094.1 hypothetical protein [Cellulomonas fengjieae]
MAVAAVTASAGVALVVTAWFVVGSSHAVFPALVTCLWVGAAAFVGPGVGDSIPVHWTRVSSRELNWHRRLGVARFDRLLEWIGWNRVVRAMRGTAAPLDRSAVGDLQRHVRAAMAGHAMAAVVHLAVTVACLLAGSMVSAAVTAAAGAVLHGWPMLLQRSTLARIQRVRRTRSVHSSWHEENGP